jgi:hypothetical protein
VAMTTFWRTFHHDGKINPGLVSVGGARPPPLTLSTITYKVIVYAPAERADTLTLILLYPYIYSVGGMTSSCNHLPAPAKVLLFEY